MGTLKRECFFYGIKPVRMIWHGQWADPELEYWRHRINYYEVEDYFWARYKEEAPVVTEAGFASWMKDHGKEVKAFILEFS